MKEQSALFTSKATMLRKEPIMNGRLDGLLHSAVPAFPNKNKIFDPTFEMGMSAVVTAARNFIRKLFVIINNGSIILNLII